MSDRPSEKPTLNDVKPLIGRVVQNYRIEKQLGKGGMGCVYLVRHVSLPETFLALKLLQPGMRDVTVQRFKQEAHAASAVGSHRVVKVFDTGELEDGQPYILMEYVNGCSLAEELSAVGAFPVERALKIAHRVADTLVIAHDKQIVHRDIKPANLMLSQEHGVKVLDFGVARATGAHRLVETQDRQIVGTVGYMAPEVALGADADGRADVFSLGVVLFEMLAGKRPFSDAGAYHENVINMLSTPVPPIASLGRPAALDTVPPFVEETVGRALAKDPSKRLTMAQLHAELWGCMRRLSDAGGIPRSPMASMISTAVPLEETPSNAPTLRAPSEAVAELISRLATPQPGPLAPSQSSSVSMASAVTPRLSRPRWLVPAAAAAGAVVAGVLVVAAVSGRVAPSPVAPSPVAPSPVAPSPVAPSPVAPSPSTAGRIRVLTTPIGAFVSLDGREVGRAPVVVSGGVGKRARVRVTLDGYAPFEDVVTFAFDDGDEVVQLHRTAKPQPKKRAPVETPLNPFEANP